MNGAATMASPSSRRIGPAGKHGRRLPTRSLNERVRDEEGSLVELSETLDDRARLRRIGRHKRSQSELSGLALDVEHVLSRLPSRLRRLCEHFKVMSVGEISRQTGVTEARLHEDVETLRALFGEAGLAEYLPGVSIPVSADEASDG